MNGTGVKVSLNVAGKNFATLSGLVGTALPAIGPYEFAATIVNKKSRWHLKQVKLKVGKSNLSGDVYIDPNTAPVRIVARLQSELVRAVDFEEKSAPRKRGRSKRRKKNFLRNGYFPPIASRIPGRGRYRRKCSSRQNIFRLMISRSRTLPSLLP